MSHFLPFTYSMLKDDLKLSSSEDSDGEQVCSFSTKVSGKYSKHVDNLVVQQRSVLPTANRAAPRFIIKKQKSISKFLNKLQVFHNTNWGKIICFVWIVCLYLKTLAFLISNGLSMKIKRSVLHNRCNGLPLKDRTLHVLPCCLTHAWHKHFCAGTVFGMIRVTVFVLYSQVLSVTGYSSTFIAIDKSFFSSLSILMLCGFC